MGSSASKAARSAGPGIRKYPTRTPSATTHASPPPRPPPVQAARPTPSAAESRPPPAVDSDFRDPGLASRLNTLGAVQPNPHFSPSSVSHLDPQRNPSHDFPADMMQAPPPSAFPDPRDNPALNLLEARQRIQDVAERELQDMGRRGFPGRSYTDAATIQLALMRRKRGEDSARIEAALGLQKGRLDVLGRNIVDTVQ